MPILFLLRSIDPSRNDDCDARDEVLASEKNPFIGISDAVSFTRSLLIHSILSMSNVC